MDFVVQHRKAPQTHDIPIANGAQRVVGVYTDWKIREKALTPVCVQGLV